MPHALDPEAHSLLEEAADELARLDDRCTTAPASIARALWLRVIADLSEPGAASLPALVAAEGDPLHDAALGDRTLQWRAMMESEGRRVRGGASLSVTRLVELIPALGTYPERSRLEAIWRESGRGRPVLVRALDSTAWFPEADEDAPDAPDAPGTPGASDPPNARHAVRTDHAARASDAVAALILCAGGRTDRVRLLPFARVAPVRRRDAILAWRAGDGTPWAHAALGVAAQGARQLRDAVRSAHDGMAREDDAVRAMGRAGITAQRALEAARTLLAVTMPTLADELEVSRPAAAAALERLADASLLREVTGRARDRVYAYDAAMAVAASAAAS